jgi:hypothetical protein
MTGPRAPLRLPAMAAALIAAAAPPGLGAWAAPAPSPLAIKVGQAKDLSHIEFHWSGPAPYTVRRDGQTLVLHFQRDADPDLTLLRVDPPAFLQTADIRRGGGGMDLILTLKPGADAKAGVADGALYVNLFPAAKADPAPVTAAAIAQRPDPQPVSGVVKVKTEIIGGQVLMHFSWRAPLGAAAFRRGDGVWMVFDTPATLDLGALPPATPIFKGVQAVSGDGFSAVRVASPGGAAVRAWADGATWTLAIGAGPQGWPGQVKAERDAAASIATLKAQIAGATKAVWIADPSVGDRIGAVTALAPAKGLAARRDFVDLTLLPTAQGLAFEPIADDLAVSFDTDWVRISRPRGLTLSSPTATAARAAPDMGLPQPAAMPGLINFADWSRTGPDGFMVRYGDLQNAVADEIQRERTGDKQAGVKARMALVRFLMGSELSYEAIGMLNLVAKAHPEIMGDPEFRGLRGAARAMVGRYKEAETDFSAPALTEDPYSALWRGYIAAQQSDWAAAKDAFSQGSSALNQFSPAWQARFARAYAETAVHLDQLDTAGTEIALALSQAKDPNEQLADQLVQAELIEKQGFPKRALAIYDAVARAPFDGLAAPALLHATLIRASDGEISVAQAAQTYDSLRFRWRGDSTELKAIRALGALYLSQGHYREALEAMRSAGGHASGDPEAVALQADMGKAFRQLFLDGQAGGMEPVQALALFTDFKDLTPVGADGDLMVRKMVERLVDVDLLDQAADLLKYQVDNRLDGMAKAEVATTLATLYLMDRKPEQAIDAINASRTTVLPTALANQRRMVEARAWLALKQNDHALELVGKDASADADDIRAQVAWQLHQWPQVGALMEKSLGDRWKAAGPLAPDEEARLLRAAIAYSLANDDGALDRLRGHYGAMVDKAAAPEALRVALAGTATVAASLADFSKVAATDDLFAGWVSKMKAHFKDAPTIAPSKGKIAAADTAARG